MSATTVKLEGAILSEIARVKPQNQTLTAFVREAVEQKVRERKLREAAIRFEELRKENPALCEEAEEWESAPLADPIGKRRHK